MTIEFNQLEAAAIQRVVDAALKGSGVNILVEAGFLQSKLKTAVETERQIEAAVKQQTVKPEINEQS
jgi:hypothetical protein